MAEHFKRQQLTVSLINSDLFGIPWNSQPRLNRSGIHRQTSECPSRLGGKMLESETRRNQPSITKATTVQLLLLARWRAHLPPSLLRYPEQNRVLNDWPCTWHTPTITVPNLSQPQTVGKNCLDYNDVFPKVATTLPTPLGNVRPSQATSKGVRRHHATCWGGIPQAQASSLGQKGCNDSDLLIHVVISKKTVANIIVTQLTMFVVSCFTPSCLHYFECLFWLGESEAKAQSFMAVYLSLYMFKLVSHKVT